MDDCVGFETFPRSLDRAKIREIEDSAGESMYLPAWRPSSSGLHEVLPDQSRRPGNDDTRCHGRWSTAVSISGIESGAADPRLCPSAAYDPLHSRYSCPRTR